MDGLAASVLFFASGVFNGLWLAFIGQFLIDAASQSYRRIVVQDLLDDAPVTLFMRSDKTEESGMIFNRILCAVDFSKTSLEAFRRATEMALTEWRALGKIVLTVRNATTLS